MHAFRCMISSVLNRDMARSHIMLLYRLGHASHAGNRSQSDSLSNKQLLHDINKNRDVTEMIHILEKNKELINERHLLAMLKFVCKSYKENGHLGQNSDEQKYYLQLFSILENLVDDILENNKVIDTSGMKLIGNKTQSSYFESDLTSKAVFQMSQDQGGNEDNDFYMMNSGLYKAIETNQTKATEYFLSKFENFNFNSNQALQIFKTLCSLKNYEKNYIDLLHKLYETMKQGVEDLSTRDMIVISSKMVESTISNKELFYNPDILDAFVKRFTRDKLGLSGAITFTQNLTALRHSSQEMLEYVCNEFHTVLCNKTLSPQKEIKLFVVIITALATMNIKTNSIFPVILKMISLKKIIKDVNETSLCIISLNLACLDYYPNNVLQNTFSSQVLFSSSTYLKWTFCRLWQNVKAFSNYNGIMPSKKHIKLIRSLSSKRSKKQFPVLDTLKDMLGSDIYIKTDVLTKLYHQIDHVLCYRTGGFPIALNSQSNINTENDSKSLENQTFLEDIPVPADSQLILILYLPNHWYLRNETKLTGQYSSYKDSLEKLGPYSIVAINDKEWEQMSEKQKRMNLIQEINLRLPQAKIL